MATIQTGTGDVLEIRREQIEVTSYSPQPDPDWRYRDAQGHEHYRDDHAWPTLRWVIDDTWFDPDDGDEMTSGHYECVICGEHIEPGMRPPSPFREFVMGPTTYYLNGEPITEDEARAFIA